MLNRIWKQLKIDLPSDQMQDLLVEQRQWLKFRDSTAYEATANVYDVNQQNMVRVKTKTDLTRERCYQLVELNM
jgi:uncharacterized protein YecT (DUF1311 family)